MRKRLPSKNGSFNCDLKVQISQHDQEILDEYTQFNKKRGTAGISGQLYEIYLSMLFLLQGVTQTSIKQFYLASNMLEAGVFDDVVFACKYTDQGNRTKSEAIFLQAKHRESMAKSISLETLLAETEKGDFLLQKYFYHFREMKTIFMTKETATHPIFGNDFNSSKFVIYTNALLKYGESEAGNFEECEVDKHCVFNLIENDMSYYRITLCGNKRDKIIKYFQQCTHLRKLVVELVKIVTTGEALDLGKDIFARYHSTLAESVIEKQGRFKECFINDETCVFRKEFCTEMEFPESEYKRKLSEVFINLSDKFGNINRCAPILPLPADYVNENDIADFLSKLRIFVSQPNETQLRDIIKRKIKLAYNVDERDIDAIFSDIECKMRNWWKESNQYITKSNSLFEESARVSIKFNVKDPVPFFTGRRECLNDLHETLQRTSVAVVTGLWGIGKSELARKYIAEKSKVYDDNVIWINADNHANLSESFRKLAENKLRINIKTQNNEEKDIGTIIAETYQFFAEKRRKSIFIYDDAQWNDSDGLLMFLPSGTNKPHVIITSRDRDWYGLATLNLNLFDVNEAILFITKSLNYPNVDECEAELLAKTFEYLPMALRQAVAYISIENNKLNKWGNEHFTIDKYLERFEKSASKLLAIIPNEIHDSYDKTAFTTWQMSIDKIKKNEHGESALEILNIIAYLISDNIVVNEIFAYNEHLKTCIELLNQHSLVKLENGSLSVLRLVQQVTRIKLKNNGEEEKRVLKKALELFQSDVNSTNVDHVLSVWNYAKDYIELVKTFFTVPINIIKTLEFTVRYKEAHSIAIATSELLATSLHKDHYAVLTSKHCTASILHKQGKYNDALELYQEVLHKRERILYPYHPDILISMNSIASIFAHEKNYRYALELCQEAVKKCKQTGIDDRVSLMIMNNIAFILDKQGEYGKTVEMYQEILEKMISLLGSDHLDTLGTMNNIALAYQNQGKYRRALSIYEKVLCKVQLILGPHHPDTLKVMGKKASALHKLEKYDESEKLYKEVFEGMKQILGPDHPSTLKILDAIALVLRDQGKHGMTLMLYQEELYYMNKVLGMDHPATLRTMEKVGLEYFNQGKYQSAIKIYEEVLNKLQRIFGPDNLDVLNSMECKAAAFYKLTKYEEASTIYEHVLKKRVQILGTHHPKTIETLEKIRSIQAN